MLSDHIYDLMSQLVVESQSLWRIKNSYKKNAVGCDECVSLWSKLEREKQSNIDELTKLLRKHLST